MVAGARTPRLRETRDLSSDGTSCQESDTKTQCLDEEKETAMKKGCLAATKFN